MGTVVGPEAATLASWAEVLSDLGDSRMDAVAYDTAWLARVPGAAGRPAFPAAWGWLRSHQHADGSWGADVAWLPDRLAATLAAVVALADPLAPGSDSRRPRDGRWPQGAIRTALGYLARAAAALAARSPSARETVGFELCVPALLERARGLGLALLRPLPAVEERRAHKLGLLPPDWRQRPPPSLVHSLEGWASEPLPDGLLTAGSCANSPSATAYHQLSRPDPAARGYLDRALVAAGGARDVYPFEVFEIAWSLEHLALAGVPLCLPRLARHVDRLQRAWDPAAGAGISASGLEPDADDTALAAVTLARAGRAVGLEPLRTFERADGFACFPFEHDPSCSANIHAAYAIARLPYPGRRAALRKVIGFLEDTLAPEGFWIDKWHLSPYYPTARAVIALGGLAPQLTAGAVAWLRGSQRADGGWGWRASTPEETAYAVEALAAGGAADPAAMGRAAAYLAECRERPALWIGKGLYCPRTVVDAAVAAAIRIARRWVG